MVAPNSLDDGAIHKLAYDIARKIEGEMKYPGQIKVIVIGRPALWNLPSRWKY